MLNYNKIHSSINFQRTAKSTLAKFMGIANSTLIDRLEKKNLTPDDVEKIADFFGKPMAYYFDREKKEAFTYVHEAAHIIVNNEQKETTDPCQECIKKESTIKDLRENINDLRKHIELLEFSLGKNRKNNSG